MTETPPRGTQRPELPAQVTQTLHRVSEELFTALRLNADGDSRAAFIAAMTPRTAWEVLHHAVDVGLQQAWEAGDVAGVARMLTALPADPTQG